jgi:hypothetical protein
MPLSSSPPGPLAKFLTLIVGGILLVLGLMFSMVLFGVIVVLSLFAGGYFWWKTRHVRKVMQAAMEQAAQQGPDRGEVIEGEAVVVDDGSTTQVISITCDADRPAR